jgi:hypothetical protein
MTPAPRPSLTPNPHSGQSASAAREVAKDQVFPHVRLPAAERQFLTQLLSLLDEQLSVEAMMFLAGGAERKAQRKQAGEG